MWPRGTGAGRGSDNEDTPGGVATRKRGRPFEGVLETSREKNRATAWDDSQGGRQAWADRKVLYDGLLRHSKVRNWVAACSVFEHILLKS
jgi:hypothetical protein